MSNTFTNILAKIVGGITWLGKEVVKLSTELPKIITLTDDAENIASDALPKVLAVVDDAKALAVAGVAETGPILTDLAALGAAVALAIAAKGINLTADAGVAAAVEKLVATAQTESYATVVATWHALVTSVAALDETVVADLKKLEADAA